MSLGAPAVDFGEPAMLQGLWLVPLALACLFQAYRRRRARLARVQGRAAAAVRVSAPRALVKGALLTLSLAAVIVALARPRWGFDWVDVKRRGVDLVIAFDVSRSMLAEDVTPSRLERAKREVIDFLSMLKGDRIGLVAFAGQAFIQCPVTQDYDAVRMFLDYLSPDLIPVQGTDLKGAVATALKALSESDPKTSKAVILITDGEDTEGQGREAAKLAKEQGVPVYTIGVGSEGGGPIPEPGGGFKKDANGNVVLTKPDEAALTELALATGGMFVRSVAGGMDLVRIYQEGIKSKLPETELQETREKLWHEKFPWFLGLAAALLVGELLITDIVVGAALVCLVFGGGGGAPEAVAADLGGARAAFEKGNYDEAARKFQEAEIEAPDEPEHAYNRAVSQYRAGKYHEAAEGFAKAAEHLAEREAKARALFDLGNAHVGEKKLDEAIKAYEDELKLKPDDEAAKQNLEHVKKLKEQQKQDEQKQDQQKQDQQQQKQDQQQQKQDQQQQKQDQQQNSGNGQKDQSSQGAGGEPQPQKPDSSPASQDGKTQQQPEAKPESAEGDKAGRSESGQGAQNKPDPAQTPQNQASAGASGSPQQSPDKQPHEQPGKAGDKEHESKAAADSSQDKAAAAGAAARGTEQKEQKGSSAGSAAVPASADERAGKLGDEEAERVLRAVQDQAGKYLYAPARGSAPPRQSDKDW